MNRIEKESLEEGDYYKSTDLRAPKSLGQQLDLNLLNRKGTPVSFFLNSCIHS